jgi:formylglycine-generating enzyme required for sulfatase activity
VITVSGAPGNRQGLVFYGVDNTGVTPTPWSAQSSSFRCVKAPIQRLGAPQGSGGVSGQCNGSYVINWDAFQNANPSALGNPWTPAEGVFAQAWYRDPLAPNASNLSNALELTLRNPPPVPCVTTIPGLVAIPAGTFDMGSSAPCIGPCSELPVHPVTISSCFWMGATEVTQAQYSALIGGAPPQLVLDPSRPVANVSWFDAQAYCAALTAQQAALGNVPPGYQYRLPTEAEWEYACRAGTVTEFNVGSAVTCADAWMVSPSDPSSALCWDFSLPLPWPGPKPVASYAPNAWGLYDMHGNVAEWCLDSWAFYSAGAVTDPFVNGGANRVLRGGDWMSEARWCTSAIRYYSSDPSGVGDTVGFRVVLAPILAP